MAGLAVQTAAGFNNSQYDLALLASADEAGVNGPVNGVYTLATQVGAAVFFVFGTNFGSIDGDGFPHTGTVTGWSEQLNGNLFVINGISISVPDFQAIVERRDSAALNAAMFSGNDSITGAAGADTLYAFGGNDQIIGGFGADTMYGGAGDDGYSVDNANDKVMEFAGEGRDFISTSINFTLPDNVEDLSLAGTAAINGTGNAEKNSILGNAGANILNGGAGDDILTGGGGDDTLIGGAGADLLNGSGGVDTASYADFVGGAVASLTTQFSEGADGDFLNNIENLLGGAGNDVLTGNEVANRLDGGDGNDVLEGAAGDDVLIGGAGIDTVRFSLATVGVTANLGIAGAQSTGEGTDTFSGIEYLTGGNFNDVLTGDSGGNILTGGAGNDVLDGGAGADVLVGGLGDDTYIISASTEDTITELAGQGSDTIRTALATYTLHVDIENLAYSGSGAFSGTGNALDNLLTGGPGANTLDGAGGTDGAQLSFLAATQVVDASTTSVTVGGVSAATLISIERILITGGSANDVLTGGVFDDVLIGGVGNDVMVGGAGNDTYEIDSAGDRVIETGGGSDTVRTYVANTSVGAFVNIENLIYTGSANFIGLGDANANALTGAAGNDYFYTYAGDDIATGNGGVDVFILDAGNDTASGGDGQDYLFGGDGADTLNGDGGVDVLLGGAGNDVMNGGAEGDYFYGEDGDDTGNGGDGNDIFVMTAGNDTANGDAGQDYFYMGAGDDVMKGGAGVDVMLGEAGNDTFNGGLGVDYLFLGPGGAGDNDTVQVDVGATGVQVVYGFEAGGANDAIRITGASPIGSTYTTFAQVQQATIDFTASGGFCIISLDADTAIWLIGVAPGQLTAADFVFA